MARGVRRSALCNHSRARRTDGNPSVKVYGINHIAIEVNDVGNAVAFYGDVFGLEKLDEGEGDAFFEVGEQQFLAMFESGNVQPNRTRHFGPIVRDQTRRLGR